MKSAIFIAFLAIFITVGDCHVSSWYLLSSFSANQFLSEENPGSLRKSRCRFRRPSFLQIQNARFENKPDRLRLQHGGGVIQERHQRPWSNGEEEEKIEESCVFLQLILQVYAEFSNRYQRLPLVVKKNICDRFSNELMPLVSLIKRYSIMASPCPILAVSYDWIRLRICNVMRLLGEILGEKCDVRWGRNYDSNHALEENDVPNSPGGFSWQTSDRSSHLRSI